MTGRLGLTSPWTRRYLPAERRAAVVAEIPPGCTLGVGVVGRRPGTWSIWLLVAGRVAWSTAVRDPDLGRACLTALASHRPAAVWCAACPDPSVIEIHGEAWCASHLPREEAVA